MLAFLTLQRLWFVSMCLLISAAKTNAHWGASWFQSENGVVQLNTKDDRPSKYLQKSFQDADKSLQFFEEARLCKREATLKLISTSTCKELLQDPRRDDIEMILDLYAIELAKCEIESASVKLPGSCQFELPSGTLENGVQRTTQTELSRCLAALHSKPQWWTSYSNHRRDGYQWCLVMKPGFDHNEHVKVWKCIYSTLDVSSTAIKDVLYDILSWSEKSQVSLKSSFAYFTSMMESLQLRVETTIESIENRFHDADNFLKERMDNLYDGLTATEEQLKDIQLVTQSSSTGLHIIQEDIATIGIIQNTQLEQTRNINSELLVIQTLTKDTHNNITSEQDLVMNRFAMIREASEQLGQTILDANDHMHDLKFALTALSSFSNLVTYLKWTTVVLAMAFFNRKVAIYLALAILIIQELSAYFRGIKLDPLYAILESLYNSNNLQRNFRLIGIVALTWYLIYTRRSKLKSTSIPSSSERNWKTNTQRYNYYLPPPPYLPSLPFHTMQQAGYISPSHYRGPKSKKFEREQSAPL